MSFFQTIHCYSALLRTHSVQKFCMGGGFGFWVNTTVYYMHCLSCSILLAKGTSTLLSLLDGGSWLLCCWNICNRKGARQNKKNHLRGWGVAEEQEEGVINTEKLRDRPVAGSRQYQYNLHDLGNSGSCFAQLFLFIQQEGASPWLEQLELVYDVC